MYFVTRFQKDNSPIGQITKKQKKNLVQEWSIQIDATIVSMFLKPKGEILS